MKARFSRLVFLVLTAVLLASCSGSSTVDSYKPPLRFEYTQWWPDYTIVVAKEKGFFEKHGVIVEPIYYENFPQALADLPAQKIDGGLLALGDALVVSQASSLKVVAVYDDGGYNAVVALPDIQSVADVKGKRIGVLIGTSYELFVRHMLQSAGLRPTDVTFVNLAPSEVATHLANGDIAAGYTWDRSLTEGYPIIYQKADAPGLFPDVIVFREDVIRERPDDVRAFLRAWFEAVDYRKQNPEETREIVAKYTGLPLEQIYIDDEIHIMGLDDNLAIFAGENTEGISLVEAVQINAEFQAQAGFMSISPNLTVFLDSSFLK